MNQPLFFLPFAIIAFLYSMAGLGGGSGYTLWMWAYGIDRTEIPLFSLTLNVAVAGIALWNYARRGYYNRRYLLLLLISLPTAIGTGRLALSPQSFDLFLGAVLFVIVLARTLPKPAERDNVVFSVGLIFLVGFVTGCLAGLLGIGGGVVAGPLLITLRVTKTKEASCASALLVFANSLGGLLPRLEALPSHFYPLLLLLMLVVPAGFLGSKLGSGRLSPQGVKMAFGIAVCFVLIYKVARYAVG